MARTTGLNARQIKAARALLDWSQQDLANTSSLSVATIRKLELGNISPREGTYQLIIRALEKAGLEFIEPSGVRLRPEEVTIYQGADGAKAFFDDVYNVLNRDGGDYLNVCSSSDTEKTFADVLGDYRQMHMDRMFAIRSNISVKCILMEPNDVLPSKDYAEYRYISKQYVHSVPFYVYGDKYAIKILGESAYVKFFVFQSRSVADAFRLQFYSLWEKATPLNRSLKAKHSVK